MEARDDPGDGPLPKRTATPLPSDPGRRIADKPPPRLSGHLSTFNIVITAIAAIAGVVFAGIQTFSTSYSSLAPINVTLALDPHKVAGAGVEVEKNQGLPTAEAVNVPVKGDGVVQASAPAGTLVPIA